MPADFSRLQAAIDKLVTQADTTVGTEASAVVLINGFSAQVQAAVTAALEADNAADQGSIDAAMAAIGDTTTKFVDSASALGAAVASNPGPSDTPPPEPPALSRKR